MISRVGLLNKPVLTSSILRASLAPASRNAFRFLSTKTPTIKSTEEEAQSILVSQRKNRPSSPHLTVYEPQLTWILSSFHRITGVAMAGAFYALTCSFAASSILGYNLDTATLVSAFTELPTTLQYGIKAMCAYPFVFHVGNGIRHLTWDFGKELSISGVYRTGYAVMAATAIVGSYLAFVWQ